MYNFFSYFLAVYFIVFGTIIIWFVIQCRSEKRTLSELKDN